MKLGVCWVLGFGFRCLDVLLKGLVVRLLVVGFVLQFCWYEMLAAWGFDCFGCCLWVLARCLAWLVAVCAVALFWGLLSVIGGCPVACFLL